MFFKDLYVVKLFTAYYYVLQVMIQWLQRVVSSDLHSKGFLRSDLKKKRVPASNLRKRKKEEQTIEHLTVNNEFYYTKFFTCIGDNWMVQETGKKYHGKNID